MATEVGEEAHAAACALVVVFEGSTDGTASNVLVGIPQGAVRRAGMRSVEVREVGIDVGVPMLVEVVAQFQIAAVLLETHARTVVVRAAVLTGEGAGEASGTGLIGHLCLHRSVGAAAELQLGGNPVATFAEGGIAAPGDDVDDAAHRIAAVEHGGWAAEHFDPLGHECLVGIGDGVAVDALILRMTVDEHQQLSGTAADAAQVDAACSTAAHAVAHHATRGDEQAGDLLREGGEQAELLVFGERLTVDDGDRRGQMTLVGGIAGSRHHQLREQGVTLGKTETAHE